MTTPTNSDELAAWVKDNFGPALDDCILSCRVYKLLGAPDKDLWTVAFAYGAYAASKTTDATFKRIE